MKKIYGWLLAVLLAAAFTACGDGEAPTAPQPEEPAQTETGDGEEGPVIYEESDLYRLKTDDYREKSVADFNRAFAPYRDVYSGYGPSHPDAEFMQTLLFSTMELLAVENNHVPYLSTGSGHGNWQLDLVFSWRIDHPESVSVGQRDDWLRSGQDAAYEAFAAMGEQVTDPAAAQSLGEQLQERCDAIAAELSQDWGDLDIAVEFLQFAAD